MVLRWRPSKRWPPWDRRRSSGRWHFSGRRRSWGRWNSWDQLRSSGHWGLLDRWHPWDHRRETLPVHCLEQYSCHYLRLRRECLDDAAILKSDTGSFPATMRHIAHCLLMNCGLAQDESYEMQLFSRRFDYQPQVRGGIWLGYNKERSAKSCSVKSADDIPRKLRDALNDATKLRAS